MCCLKYEQEAYEDLVKRSPRQESFVETPDGAGTVSSVNLLRQTVQVRLESAPETPKCYQNCEVCVIRNGKGKRPEGYVQPPLEELAKLRRPADQEEAVGNGPEDLILEREADMLQEGRGTAPPAAAGAGAATGARRPERTDSAGLPESRASQERRSPLTQKGPRRRGRRKRPAAAGDAAPGETAGAGPHQRENNIGRGRPAKPAPVSS